MGVPVGALVQLGAGEGVSLAVGDELGVAVAVGVGVKVDHGVSVSVGDGVSVGEGVGGLTVLVLPAFGPATCCPWTGSRGRLHGEARVSVAEGLTTGVAVGGDIPCR